MAMPNIPNRDDDYALSSWGEVSDYADWTGLLVGNGASVAIWPEFRYGSLFNVATSGDVDHQLANEDQSLFDAFDTEIWSTRERWTRLLFMHGGIHLRRLRGGGTRKVTAEEGSILDQFSTAYGGEESPLLVSEGESADKLASILSSDYLSFAHQM